MRYRLAVSMLLMLLVVLPMMHLPAAPTPDPSAILDIGLPPNLGKTEEQFLKDQRERQTGRITLIRVLNDPDVRKLPSIAGVKDPLPWLAKNLRVTEENEGRRLRFTFRAGGRAEQVTILNAFLRVHLALKERRIRNGEEWLRIHEKRLIESGQRLNSAKHPTEVARLQEAIQYARTKKIPETRAAIAHLKQSAVIKWAK